MVCSATYAFFQVKKNVGSILAKTKENLSHITLIAIEAALLAGEILREGFGGNFQISSKDGCHNLVTEYDHKSEKAVIDFLKQNVKNSHFLAEESGAIGKTSAEVFWIIDPLDGTVNFAHGLPHFAVSIAAQIDKEMVTGVIYQPITHELFIAEKGHGAFLNGKKIEVSKNSEMKQAILATGFPYDLAKNPFHCIEHFVDILKLGIPIRRLGSAAIDLAYTAAGRFDGFFEVELAPWDIAAGKLLVEEAGGKITHWDGSHFDIHSRKPLLASNGKIHSAGCQILNRRV
jgi:myo-inositol-1(or 4)-monophosphatase